MTDRYKAKAGFIAASALWGTLSVFVKNIELSSAGVALCRAVLAVVVIGAWLLLTGRAGTLRGAGREAPLLAASGAAMGINWILLFEAYKYTTVSSATLSYYFAPVLVTALCPFLYREKLTKRQVFCFVMSTIGLALVVTGGTGLAGAGLKGICLGLGAALFYAAVILINKGLTRLGGIQRTFYQLLAAAVVLTPYTLFTGSLELSELDSAGWASLLTVGIVHTGIACCVYFSALGKMSGQEASVLSYIDPLSAVIVSVAVLGEPISAAQALGGALILGFAMLNELPAKKEKAP